MRSGDGLLGKRHQGEKEMKAMTYASVEDDSTIDDLIVNDLWVMEQKMDGTRGLAVLTHEGPQMMSRSGPLKHTAATQWLDPIWASLAHIGKQLTPGDMLVFDGEIMIHDGRYLLFDVPHFVIQGQRIIGPDDTFARRRQVLEKLGADVLGVKPTTVVVQAKTADEKRAMLQRCREQGVEGVMFKNTFGVYTPGQRSKDGLKVKFVKTADVIVTLVHRERNEAGREVGSIQFGVLTSRGMQIIGRCSVIGKPHVEPGDVIEVAYLYWTGSTTYQPRMVRVRDDKRAEECGIDQFRPYTRQAVAQ